MRPVLLVRRAGSRLAGPVLHRLAAAAGGPPPGLRRGGDFAPADVPVLLVLVGPRSTSRAEAVLEGVASVQREGARVTPVFLLEDAEPAPYRRAGYVVELVGRRRPDGDLLDELGRTYASRDVVELAGLATVDDVGRAVRRAVPTAPTGPRERWRRALRRVEAALS